MIYIIRKILSIQHSLFINYQLWTHDRIDLAIGDSATDINQFWPHVYLASY